MIPVATTLTSTGATYPADIQRHIKTEGNIAALDLKADCGSPAVAAGDGIVHLPGQPGELGRYPMYIEITSGTWKGFHIWYGHLHEILVHNGQTVKEGEVVGKTGGAPGVGDGNTTGCHFHLGVVPAGEEFNGGGQRATDYQGTAVLRFIKGENPPKVVGGLTSYGGTANTTLATYSNDLPKDVPSIVPERIGFVIDNKWNPVNWELCWPSHSGYVGSINGTFECPSAGKLTKIVFINHSGNVVGEQDVNQDVEENELVNVDYTFSLQKFVSCSILTEQEANELMHHMVQYSLGYQDGHTKAPYTTNEYTAKKDGGDIKTTISDTKNDGTVTGLSGKEQEVGTLLAKYMPKELVTKESIAAILATFMEESTLDEHNINPKNFAAGIAQWMGSRVDNLGKFINKDISWARCTSVDSAKAEISKASLEDQIKFFSHEIVSYAAANNMKAVLNDVEKCTQWMAQHFEVCTNPTECNWAHRVSVAQGILSSDGYKATNGTTETVQVEDSGVHDSYNWLKNFFSKHPNVHFVRR